MDADSNSRREQIKRTKVYIENHWEAIIRPNSDGYARMCCSAEGQVSHLLSTYTDVWNQETSFDLDLVKRHKKK